MTTLALPTGRVPRLLYGLARRRPAPTPERSVEGWDVYIIDGLEGGRLQLALPTPAQPTTSPAEPDPDGLSLDMALAGLRRAAEDDAALPELAVLLSLLLELDRVPGQWRWQRTLDVLRGSGARPERHNDAIKQLVALLVWARVSFDDTATRAPWTWTQLLTLERITRSSRTVRLDPTFRQELAAVTYDAPGEEFLVAPPVRHPDPNKPEVAEKVANPEGNLPSRRTRARARVALMLKIAPRRRGEKPKTRLSIEIEQFMLDAGADVEPVKRRRHIQPWTLALQDELRMAANLLRVGLVWFQERLGSILRTVLHLGRPGTSGDALVTADVPVASDGSRAPP